MKRAALESLTQAGYTLGTLTVISLAMAACGARVAVGFTDEPDAGDVTADGSSPPSFAGDAARRETSAPSPGCSDKACGDFCTPCESDAATCPPASVFHVCSNEALCLAAQPGCLVIQELDGAPPPASYVPCAGRACGAACTSCDPARCTPPAPAICQADGACRALTADCR